jgi:N6-adenosine-specific RNA methylase IME4
VAYATYSPKGKGRSAEAHYDTMPLDDIRALPVGRWAAPDCVLFLWVTKPLLVHAPTIISDWGFT